jgi:hypothetical protein
MSNVYKFIIMFTAVCILIACKKPLTVQEIPAHIVVGEDYYTQYTIQYEKGRHVTTNYRRGATLPVNTEVTLQSIDHKNIEIIVKKTGMPLTIANIEKHTGKDIWQIFDALLQKHPLNLKNFTVAERDHIKAGKVTSKMRKKAVIAAIGYPPITETYSLDADTWVYWSGRFNRFNVDFKNDKVIKITD